MAINRYSKGPIAADVQSNFIPLPIDLLDRQMQREQTKYDTAKSFIGSAQEAVYGVKGMSPDSEALKQITSQYDEEIQKEIESVGGDYGKLKSYSDVLAKKVTKDVMSGHLGAINNNFVKSQNRLKELTDLRESGDISKATYNKHLNEIQTFGGTIEDGNGGYTSVEFSPVVKAIEFGKIADDYGTEIADQYKNTGEKYITAKTASGLIEKNLWNNKEIVANAENEIWNTYGELPADKKTLYVGAYIRKIAEDSGNKLAYQQRFQPDIDADNKENVTNPGIPIRYNIQGNKPISSTFNINGEDFTKVLSDISNITKEAITSAATVRMVPAGYVPGAAPVYDKNREDRAEKILLEGNKKAKEVAERATKTTIVKSLADIYKVDVITNPVEGLSELDSKLQEYNKSSSATGVSMVQNEKVKNTVENITLNSGMAYNVPAQNLQSGKQINGSKEWKEMVDNHVISKNGGKSNGRFLYSGTIETTGEMYPKGGTVVTYIDDKEGKTIDVFLPLEVRENTPEFYMDRMEAAYKANNGLPGGFITYKEHQFLVLDKKDSSGNYVIGHFINGEPAPLK